MKTGYFQKSHQIKDVGPTQEMSGTSCRNIRKKLKVRQAAEKKSRIFNYLGFQAEYGVWGYGYFASTRSFEYNILTESHKIVCGIGFFNDDR